MSRRGRHTSRSTIGRDVAIMVAGIAVIGAIVYALLWGYTTVFGGDGEAVVTTTTISTGETTEMTESSAVPTTTVPSDTTSTSTVAEATTSTVTPRQPGDVVVLVLNSVGTDGLAAQVSQELEELGYQVEEPDDYEPELERSQILFRDGFGPEAFELASVVPDAEIAMNPEPGEADIVVLLGASYDG